MDEIANAFDVKLGENFIIENDDGRTMGVFKFDRNGLWKYEKENGYYYGWHDVLFWVLIGLWGVRKMTNEEVVALTAFYARSGIYKYGLSIGI